MAGFSKAIVEIVKIAKRIGATPASLGKVELISISGTIPGLVKKGSIAPLIPDAPIYTPNGEVLFLYIPDHSYLATRGKPDTPENRNKVHLFYCQTLRDMESRGRKDRYIATNNCSGEFEIRYTNSRKVNSHLNVCQHCHRLLKNRNYGHYTSFNFAKFAEAHNYCPPWFSSVPKTIYGVDYPSNWAKLSYKIRKERNWKCEKCGLDFVHKKYLLDLHHINGVKSDCSRSNLKALCRRCHRQEPGHSHMGGAI